MDIRKDLYFVAVKIFLEDGQGNFLITKDRFVDWDIPGGRLRENDFEVDLNDVVKRKIQEELGGEVNYEMGEPVLFMRLERDEIISESEKSKRRIFSIGYRAKYISGEIKLGENHELYEWVSIKNFVAEDRFTGGWLKGVKEYQDFMVKNFSS